jgi:hypothetical protein
MAEWWLILDTIEQHVKRGISRNDYKQHVLHANLAILKLVQNNKMSFQDVESELRKRKFEHIWLQAVPPSSTLVSKKLHNLSVTNSTGLIALMYSQRNRGLGVSVSQLELLVGFWKTS